MKFRCTKCNDEFSDDANDIYATTCGHIFHCHCLMQWLDRFQTCPHCTQKQTKEDAFRLYLSSSSSIAPQNDLQELKNEFNCLSCELKLKNSERKSIKEETKVLKSKNKVLRKVFIELKDEEDSINRTISFNDFAVKYHKRICKGKDLAKLEAEVTQWTNRLSTLEGVREIVNASDNDVDDILLKSTLSEADLLICASVFERKLDACNQHNEELEDDVMLYQLETDRLEKELKTLKKEYSNLLQKLCDSEDCSEQSELRQKIFSLIQHNNLEDISYILSDLEHSNRNEQTKDTVQETPTSQETLTSSEMFKQNNLQPAPNLALQKRCKEVIKLAIKKPREYLTSGRVELYDSDEDAETVPKKKTDNKHYSSSKLNNNFNHDKYKKRIKNKHLSADCGLFKKPKTQKVDMKDIDRSVYALMASDS